MAKIGKYNQDKTFLWLAFRNHPWSVY